MYDQVWTNTAIQITQVQLASSLKKHQSYVAKVENFERRLDSIELYDWLKVLDENFNSLEKIFEEVWSKYNLYFHALIEYQNSYV